MPERAANSPRSADLQKHIDNILLKPYHCDDCPQRFAHSSSLILHKRTFHDAGSGPKVKREPVLEVGSAHDVPTSLASIMSLDSLQVAENSESQFVIIGSIPIVDIDGSQILSYGTVSLEDIETSQLLNTDAVNSAVTCSPSTQDLDSVAQAGIVYNLFQTYDTLPEAAASNPPIHVEAVVQSDFQSSGSGTSSMADSRSNQFQSSLTLPKSTNSTSVTHGSVLQTPIRNNHLQNSGTLPIAGVRSNQQLSSRNLPKAATSTSLSHVGGVLQAPIKTNHLQNPGTAPLAGFRSNQHQRAA